MQTFLDQQDFFQCLTFNDSNSNSKKKVPNNDYNYNEKKKVAVVDPLLGEKVCVSGPTCRKISWLFSSCLVSY